MHENRTHTLKKKKWRGRKKEGGMRSQRQGKSCTSLLPNFKLCAFEIFGDPFCVLVFHRKSCFLYLGLRKLG